MQFERLSAHHHGAREERCHDNKRMTISHREFLSLPYRSDNFVQWRETKHKLSGLLAQFPAIEHQKQPVKQNIKVQMFH